MSQQKKIKISIITPTILRTSLFDTIESIDNQDYDFWEHIIVVDKETECPALDRLVTKNQTRKTRKVVYIQQSNNYGNTPRREGWEYATGDYIMYMDDDDLYMPYAFRLITQELKRNQLPTWAIFPGQLGTRYFLRLPPGLDHTMSNQFIHRKYDPSGQPIRWPKVARNNPQCCYDGRFINSLVAKYPHVILDTGIAVYVTHQNYGKKI
jgi:hypothetical protein